MSNKLPTYKKYLDPKVVSKLSTLELKAKQVVEGFMVGLHKSPYHGFSVEFSQHRSYMQGDPIKNIDWKVFAKSEKYFIKQYEEETNLLAHVVLDVSSSMDFKYKGDVSKFEYASTLAASLMYLIVKQQDSAGLVLYSNKLEQYFTPKANRVYLTELLKSLDNTKPVNSTKTGECLNQVADSIKQRGMVVIISDFLDDPETIFSAVKKLHYKKNEIILFHVMDEVELDFSFERDAVFVDKETGMEITTQPAQLRKAYQDKINEFISKLKKESGALGIEYNLIDTSTPYDIAILNYFKKRNKLS